MRAISIEMLKRFDCNCVYEWATVRLEPLVHDVNDRQLLSFDVNNYEGFVLVIYQHGSIKF